MTFVAGCDEPGDAVRDPLNPDENILEEDTEMKECYLLFKEVENMQGNYDDKKIKDDFYAEIDKRAAAAGGKELDEAYKEKEGNHVIDDDPETYDLIHSKKEDDGDVSYIATSCFGGLKKSTQDTKYDYTEKLYVTEQSEILKKVYPEFTQELEGYKRLLSVVQGTWSKVIKKQSKFSFDDNGLQISIRITGNHVVQLDYPVIEDVIPTSLKEHGDTVIKGQASQQFNCRMADASTGAFTDERYAGKPIMMLSQNGQDIMFIVLNEDNSIIINFENDAGLETAKKLFGKRTVSELFIFNDYTKVQ